MLAGVVWTQARARCCAPCSVTKNDFGCTLLRVQSIAHTMSSSSVYHGSVLARGASQFHWRAFLQVSVAERSREGKGLRSVFCAGWDEKRERTPDGQTGQPASPVTWKAFSCGQIYLFFSVPEIRAARIPVCYCCCRTVRLASRAPQHKGKITHRVCSTRTAHDHVKGWSSKGGQEEEGEAVEVEAGMRGLLLGSKPARSLLRGGGDSARGKFTKITWKRR